MIGSAIEVFLDLLGAAWSGGWWDLALKFVPFALFLELPLLFFVLAGVVKYALRQLVADPPRNHFPSVSCVLTCYSEGEAVQQAIRSLAEQRYPGRIEILAIIDGAVQNGDTLRAARACVAAVDELPGRRLLVVPKWQRGGRVSSLNTGLMLATSEIIMALDGDTSFDCDMVALATRHFVDSGVVGVAGCLRVRNAKLSLATRLQAIEYILSIATGKTGLSEFNVVNNISGAFGVFRTEFLRGIGGWDTGTAEDLNLTLRIKKYFGRHPGLRIVFEPHAVGHTDAPDSFRGFFQQRLRWDGDLFYLYVRKHSYSLRPALLGWRNFLAVLLPGLFFQLVMPLLIVLYTAYLFLFYPGAVVLGTLAFVYMMYLVAIVLLYLSYLAVISERPRADASYLPLLLVFPLFAFASRVHCAFSVCIEMLFRTHLDSNMAPWWVLRKDKF